MMVTTRFVTKGQVPTNAPAFYVLRPSDTQFDDYLRRADYIAVLGPRFSGKTSLLARKYHDLRTRQRNLPVYINLSLFVKLTGAAWYQRLHMSIIEGTRGALGAVTTQALAIDELSLRDALLDSLENEIKAHVLVIMLDDVEMIPPPILTPLMAMIREIFSSREMIGAFKRCVFVLSGCFLPDDLIDDPSISPFRVAERIHMTDAPFEGIEQLVRQLERPDRPVSPHLANQVHHWTQGDLYLTQRLCALLNEHAELSVGLVDQLAINYLTEDDIFQRVVRYVEKNPRILELLRQIQSHGTAVRFTRLQRHIAEAWLAGVIKENADGNCAIRNPVYETVLHQTDPGNLKLPPPLGALPTTTSIADPLLTPGRVVLQRRYRIDEPIGEGGMAQIFRAQDMLLDNTVAVKRLRIRITDYSALLERFRREGESMRQLDHPNIVRFIDLFAEADHHYLVMEYVPGGNLGQLMQREGRSLSLPTVIRIAAELSDALAHAHRHNIIHRDIKPSNVLLTPALMPRLADFGIARMIAHSPLTDSGVLLGTLSYMSPEVCRADPVGPASDLWSLGVMMFEMLAGFLPFDKPDPASILYAIVHAPIPNIRDSRPDVPPLLADLIQRLLIRNVNQRYPSAHRLSAQLRSLIARS